jgi:hypothetical protein
VLGRRLADAVTNVPAIDLKPQGVKTVVPEKAHGFFVALRNSARHILFQELVT